MAEPTNMKSGHPNREEIREAVRSRYAAAATSVTDGSEAATMVSLGCGNPTAVAS
jgi:hypothetical protein